MAPRTDHREIPNGTPALIRAAILARGPLAVDDRERASVAAFVEAFDGLEHPFSEGASPVHVTASAIVMSHRGVLLHRHKRLGIWLQVGGHIDEGELPWDAAVREASEESGLRCTHPPAGPLLCHVDVHPGPRGHTHLDLRYLLESAGEDPCPPEGESPDVRWFTRSEALAVADAGIAGALAALMPGH